MKKQIFGINMTAENKTFGDNIREIKITYDDIADDDVRIAYTHHYYPNKDLDEKEIENLLKMLLREDVGFLNLSRLTYEHYDENKGEFAGGYLKYTGHLVQKIDMAENKVRDVKWGFRIDGEDFTDDEGTGRAFNLIIQEETARKKVESVL